MCITAEDIGMAFRDALAMLPDIPKIYSMPVEGDEEVIFTEEEIAALENFFNEVE